MNRTARLVVGFINQGVVSLGSLLVLIFAARGYSSSTLGVFTIGAATYQVIVVVSRSLTGEALLVLKPGSEVEESRLRRNCLSYAVTVPLGLGIVGAVGCSLFSGAAQAVAAALAVSPALIVQDTLRHVLLREKRLLASCAADCIVVGSQVAIVAYGAAQGFDPWLLLILLGAPAAVVGYGRAFFSGAGFSIRESRDWRRSSRYLSGGLVFEATLGALVQWLTLMSVAHFGSLAEAAAFRAVMSIYGATNLVTSYLRSHYLAQLVEHGLSSVRDIWKSVLEMVALSFATVFGMYFALMVLPDSVGVELLGETWIAAAPLFALGAINRFCAASTTIPAVLLRALQAPWRAAKTRVVLGMLNIVAAPIAIAFGGARLGFVVLSVMSVLMTVLLLRICRQEFVKVDAEGEETRIG
ncbi:hypothetical protein GS439_21645 [Rhodococcus hoagii]|nr:hypothetical protein [Prescottella equi]